jgi:hypothetical protein
VELSGLLIPVTNKMKKIIKILLILIVFLIVNCQFSIINSVFAVDTPLGPISGLGPWQITPTDAGTSLSKFASVILGLLTTIGGLAVFIEFVIGGLGWITSGGDKANLEKSRNQITNAIIGMIIIVAAWAIVYLIGGVLGIDIVNPQKILPKLSPGYEELAPHQCPPGEVVVGQQCCDNMGQCHY